MPLDKLNALRLLRLERRQRRNWNLLPTCGLGRGLRSSRKASACYQSDQQKSHCQFHCPPP